MMILQGLYHFFTGFFSYCLVSLTWGLQFMQLSAELTADELGEGHRIVEVSNKHIQVGLTSYIHGVALCAQHSAPWSWPARDDNPYLLSSNDLPEWFSEKIPNLEILLLGVDDKNIPSKFRQFQPALQVECATKKIGLEIMKVASAARTYNILLGDRRAVATLLWIG